MKRVARAKATRILRDYFERFLHSEVSGSMVLLACTITALLWANSPWADSYEHLLHTKIGLSWGDKSFALSLHHWINDGLMVIFFFVVGLEIKRELLAGRLSSWRSAMFPVAAAVGGMVVPATLYAIFNAGGPGASGWGIPMATDIAFALGALAILGSRVPIGLKVFLTALAIADDLGAVLVIALFYTQEISLAALGAAAVCLVLLLGAIRLRIQPILLFILILGVWISVFASGVHATVAGILVALVIPVTARIRPDDYFATVDDRLAFLRNSGLSRQSMLEDEDQMSALAEIQDANKRMVPSGLALEHFFHPIQAFFILPVFALFNAGVHLDASALEALASPISIGIILGLALGKPVGITLFCWLIARWGGAALPEGVNWGQLAGVGCLAGIGFTMSLFVAGLAFPDPDLVETAKMGILLASSASAVFGLTLLSRSLRPPRG